MPLPSYDELVSEPQPTQQTEPLPNYNDLVATNQGAPPQTTQDQPPSMLEQAGDVGLAAIGGANTLIPNIAGLPVDLATSIQNLGIAGYGALKGALTPERRTKQGVLISPDLPDTIDPASQIGGSAWMRSMISKALGSDPFAIPDPSNPIQQKAHLGGAIAGSALLSPASSAKQAVTNVAKMAPAAGGAIAMQSAFPDEPLAPAFGAIATPFAISTIKDLPKNLPKHIPKKEALEAHQLGYKLLPTQLKHTKTQDVIQGTAGTTPVKQLLSVENQKTTNSLVKQELGIADDVPLNIDTLKAVRSQAGDVYKKANSFGAIKADAEFFNKMRRLKSSGSFAKDFPNAVKKDLAKEVDKYIVKNADSASIVGAVKQLRRDSDAGSKSLEPQTKDLARVQKKIADELEGLLVRRTKKIAPNFEKEFKDARQKIAKTYTIEKAMKGDNLNAAAPSLAKDLAKGKLTGRLKNIAEFGRNFKEVAQASPPQTTTFRPADVVPGLAGTISPELFSLVMLRPALRKMIQSKLYQARLAKLPTVTAEKILAMPEKSQVAALIQALKEGDDQ